MYMYMFFAFIRVGFAHQNPQILKYFDKNPSGVEWASYFASANLKTSIWTIDLAYLFTHFQVGNRMSTLTLGVDANYQGIDFYSSHLQVGVSVND